MNSDNKGGCLAIALGGILFILCPIVMIIFGLIYTPLEMKVFLLIWIAIIILCYTFINDKATKITISIIPTVIYAFSFASWYVNDVLNGYYGNGGLGNTIGTFLMPFMTLVPLYLIGTWIHTIIDEKKKAKIQKEIDVLNKELTICQSNIKKINLELKDRKKLTTLFLLFDICGADLSQIRLHPKVNNITELTTVLRQEEKKMIEVKAKINRLSSLHENGGKQV